MTDHLQFRMNGIQEMFTPIEMLIDVQEMVVIVLVTHLHLKTGATVMKTKHLKTGKIHIKFQLAGTTSIIAGIIHRVTSRVIPNRLILGSSALMMSGIWVGQLLATGQVSRNNSSTAAGTTRAPRFGHESGFDDGRRRGPDAGFGNDRYRGDDAGFGNDSRRDDAGFGDDRRRGPKADGRGAGRNDNSTVMEVDSGDVGRIIGLGNTVFVRHFVKPSNCFYFSYPNRCNLEYV